MNKVMMMNLLLMKMISTYSFIEGESQVEFFEMVSVDEKPHAVHPSKLLLRHKHNVHLAKKFQIRAGKCDYCNDVHMLKIWTNTIGLFIIKEKPFSEVFSLPPLSFSQPPDVESGTEMLTKSSKVDTVANSYLQIPQHSSCPGFHEPRFFPPRPCAPQTGGGSNIQGRLGPATYCPTV